MLESRRRVHDAPELTDAGDVVVVGADVVVVVAPMVVLGALELNDVVEVVLPDEEPEVVLVAVVGVAPAGLAAALLVLAGDEVEARTVWPANSVKPTVASSDPLANQKVTPRALRIPRRRWAPERSEVDMTSRR